MSKEQAMERLEAETLASAAFEGCVMCRLTAAASAEEWIAESGHGVVVLDAYGANAGHLLVIAKRHVEKTTALDGDAYADLQRLVFRANVAVETVLSPRRVYLATLGASLPLPMSFPHYHVHVVPVFESDERARPAYVFSWSSGVVSYTEAEAAALRRELRDAFPA